MQPRECDVSMKFMLSWRGNSTAKHVDLSNRRFDQFNFSDSRNVRTVRSMDKHTRQATQKTFDRIADRSALRIGRVNEIQ